jgi:hypothetical protein
MFACVSTQPFGVFVLPDVYIMNAGNFGSGQDGDFPRFSPFFAVSRYDAEAEQQGITAPAVPSLAPADPRGKAAVNLLV